MNLSYISSQNFKFFIAIEIKFLQMSILIKYLKYITKVSISKININWS